jgi:ABC-type antimicrobial peptide transport system permease subunit
VDQVLSPRKFVVLLLAGFAAFALLLAALGIYALISHGVTQRTNEMGIRMALGATTRDVSAIVMRGTIRMAAIGTTVGIVASVAVGPALQAMLFGVKPEDPLSFALAILILLGVALLAGWIPARRAARVDPAVALRQ